VVGTPVDLARLGAVERRPNQHRIAVVTVLVRDRAPSVANSRRPLTPTSEAPPWPLASAR
jgi:hypothetical protein